MMSCKEATHLMSQQLDRELTRRESLALRLHLMMCSACTGCKDNMRFLRQACSRIVDDTTSDKV